MQYIVTKNIKPSYMEKYLSDTLVKLNISFVKEVSFRGCFNPKTGYLLRYDFYLPEYNILIEYDGKDYHNTKSTKARDAIKNKFARSNNIKLIRLSGVDSMLTYCMSLLGVPTIDPIHTMYTGTKKSYFKAKKQPKKAKVSKPVEPLKPIKERILAKKNEIELLKDKRTKDWKPKPYKRIVFV